VIARTVARRHYAITNKTLSRPLAAAGLEADLAPRHYRNLRTESKNGTPRYDVTRHPRSDGATGRTGSSDTRAPVGSVSRTRKDFSWWQCFDAFESDGYAGDRLRSHAANVCLDGSDAVVRHP